ncbi:MAG: magnesium and cobalt transport protein CorA, partial [Verrucomicrobia bacterium]|nr:magnesium and cobalt transport protein CorA [Verrucomicrobiota bacterium]
MKTLDERGKWGDTHSVIESFVFSEGRPVSHNVEMEALRLARADKGLILWIDLTEPTPEETKSILELLFEFHPLAIEDCVTLSELPKIEDYEDYLFMIMHSVAITSEKTLKISELNLFLGKEFLVTYHREPIPGVTLLKERLTKGTAQQARGS